jgi:high-affinity iron transporter
MKHTAVSVPFDERSSKKSLQSLLLVSCAFLAIGLLAWQIFTVVGNPNPLAAHTSQSAAIFDIGVLVFREGLECVLVLAAISAGAATKQHSRRNPIAIGAAAGFGATLATWMIAVHILTDLSESVSALALQAATGLLAVAVLLVVMNWFFHKFYWTGWISYHNRRKQELFASAATERTSKAGLFWGLALLGFTSFYREGFEVVLFLQNYRLRLGNQSVLWGVCVGLVLSSIVAVLTFLAHRHLPYRKMLVLTGMLLGLVLVVMVGEQAQEMQLAHWITTTSLPWLAHFVPGWMGLWFSIFPTAETLLAQALAGMLVIGSYAVASRGAQTDKRDWTTRRAGRRILKGISGN